MSAERTNHREEGEKDGYKKGKNWEVRTGEEMRQKEGGLSGE